MCCIWAAQLALIYHRTHLPPTTRFNMFYVCITVSIEIFPPLGVRAEHAHPDINTRAPCPSWLRSPLLRFFEQLYLSWFRSTRRRLGWQRLNRRARSSPDTGSSAPHILRVVFSSLLPVAGRNFVSTISAARVRGLMEIYDSRLIGFNVPSISSSRSSKAPRP